MGIQFASRMEQMGASEIREILKLTLQPEIISFAGGLPAPELFPVEEMKKISVRVLEEMGVEALQYSTTEGYRPLREKIVERMAKIGVETRADDVLVISGSQQGLDFAGKIFLDPDDVVVCESPSYLGAINAFKAYECKFLEIETDDDGMIMEDLEAKLAKTDKVKMIYVIPDFQNPSGRTWSVERREGLLKIAAQYDLPIVEDNPYGELRFEGEIPPSLRSMDKDGRVIFLGTFSKTFCPGMRLGWVNAEPDLLEKFIFVKQGSDLQTSSMAQRELSLFLDEYDLDAHIDKIKAVYKKRRDLMMDTIKKEFPKEAKYTYPSGGLFTWVELPDYINTKELMVKAVEKKVAFVPGGSFHPSGNKENTMRLNYSNMSEEKIVEGITRLGQLLHAEIKK